ncbi:MAG: hypothetical protein ACXVGQ_00205 [Mycobacteriaceae bacterium]
MSDSLNVDYEAKATLTPEDVRQAVKRIYADHGHDDDWGVPVLYEESMTRHLVAALTERAPLSEDVTTHCMWGPFDHSDGRLCMYHARLGVWTFDGTNQCLRDGHPEPFTEQPTTPAPTGPEEG